MSHPGDTARAHELRPVEEQASEEDEDMERARPEGRAQGEEEEAEGGEEGMEEEAEVAKVRRSPKGPTKREREQHEATHLPYRNWCRHCVRGRGRNRPHAAARNEEEDDEDKERRVPKISIDYFFMGQEGDRAVEHPMIVMIDEATDNRYMRAVGKKGLGEGTEMEWLIKDMHEELKSWGYTGGNGGELILKSDGENSIKAVRDALGRYHGGKVTPEQPPPGESQSNGKVEEAGKTIRSYVKVFKDMLEEKTGHPIPTDAVILQWLIRWAAMLHSRFRQGADGKTAYERQRGRKCKMEVIPFGEKVFYRRLGEDDKNKLDSQWEEGIWLGHARGSNEVLIGTREGVVRAWAVKRRPEEERWSAEDLKHMQGTPARPNPQMPGNDIPVLIHLPVGDEHGLPEEPRPARVETEARRTYLKARDFKKHGYTEGCEGCRRLKAGGMTARPHTAECRARIEEMLREEADPRWVRAKERADEKVWEEIQRQEGLKTRPGAQEEGQAASSSGEGRAEKRRDEPERQEQEEQRAKRPKEEEEEATRQNKREPDEVEVGETQEDKRPKVEEPQGVKRDGDAMEEERQSVRRRVQGEEQADPMNTDVVQSLMRVDVAEMYSPPRVTEEAKRYSLKPGEAMDLTTGWDFRRRDDRAKAAKYIDEQKPRLLIGSPMCTMFSQLQNFKPWTDGKQEKWQEHREHIAFMFKLYKRQMEEGRFFLHEHPAHATSWRLEEVTKLGDRKGVHIVTGDQCMFGLTTTRRGGRQVAAARKRTKFMTNSYHIARELERSCDNTHQHQALVDGRAKEAERYPQGLCRAICRGFIKEQKNDVEKLSAVAEVRPGTCRIDPKEFHEDMEKEIRRLDDRDENAAWDDVTGMPLDRKKVQQARREEIEYVRNKKVWTKIPRAEAQRKGYKIIKTRWIDINKGDDENPVYRSRFVAKEFNTGEVPGLFAGTPPLEAARYLVHDAATWTGHEKIIMINDVARAFFEAAAIRKVCIEIPEEDMNPADRGKDLVGLLYMSLYGTRDAAKNWQDEVARMMKQWGFMQGVYNPCLYYHEKWDIRTLVHGDDFVSSGSRESMVKFREALERRFKIKTQLIGNKGGEEKSEARVLNRVLRITAQGWEYEPDQRHIDLLIEGLGLKEAKSVGSPGEDEKKWEAQENSQELPAGQAKVFRGHAARLNYLAADRPDIAYSAKEVCRAMAKPTVGAWKKLKRLVRYLLGTKRAVLTYPWQGTESDIEAYSDSDWAGCRTTGKSTSGGAVMIGEHYIKGWSSTQASITLSSAEAELVAMTKAVAETIGITNMAKDLGNSMKGIVYADSSAALAIADRKGSGKLRHINIRMLWIQEKERKDEVELRKVKGVMNPADLMTKYLAGNRGEDLARRLGQRRREGRAEAALEVQGASQLQRVTDQSQGPGGRARRCEHIAA